ncbi:hypothetical protein, partial [Caballeronia sp. LZ028]|uniref:hypothetical protein n=1 Tax=Caballeronia sp. LZ028 TaxID=3038563 RepID=UPI002855A218
MEVPLPPGCHKRLGETVGFTSRDCLNGRRSTSAFAVIRASALVRRLVAAFRPFARQPVSNDRSRRPPMRTPDPLLPLATCPAERRILKKVRSPNEATLRAAKGSQCAVSCHRNTGYVAPAGI